MKVNLDVHSVKSDVNLKYVYIYELRAKKFDGEVITSERFLSLEHAQKSLEFAQQFHVGKIYVSCRLFETICWL